MVGNGGTTSWGERTDPALLVARARQVTADLTAAEAELNGQRAARTDLERRVQQAAGLDAAAQARVRAIRPGRPLHLRHLVRRDLRTTRQWAQDHAAATGARLEAERLLLDQLRRREASARQRVAVLQQEVARAGELAVGAALERWSESGDPRASELDELGRRERQLADGLRRLHRAREAVGRALHAASATSGSLRSARRWGLADTLLDELPLVSWVKHSRIHEADADAPWVRQALRDLQRELADVGDFPEVRAMGVGRGTRTLDGWLDNPLTDLAVQRRIDGQLRERTDLAAQLHALLDELERRADELVAELARCSRQRHELACAAAAVGDDRTSVTDDFQGTPGS